MRTTPLGPTAALVGFAALTSCIELKRRGDGWRVASAEEQGMDSRALTDLTKQIRRQRWGNIHALVIARHGLLVYEEYFAGHDERLGKSLGRVVFDQHRLHDVRSISKTVTSTLVGIALARGEIRSIDTPLRELLPTYRRLLVNGKEAISLRHVLTMSAGLRWDEESIPYTNPKNDERRLSKSPDPAAFVLGQPLVAKPGSTFNYSGGLSHLLAVVLENATGLRIDEYAKKVLFGPLAIHNWEWMKSGNARPSAFSGLRLRARDLAKLGQVFLDHGRWNEKSVITPSWVEQATKTQIEFEDSEAPGFVLANGYGFQWWTNTYSSASQKLEVATAIGNGEQRVIVIPRLRLVVAMLAGFYNDPKTSWTPEVLLTRHILPALQRSPRSR